MLATDGYCQLSWLNTFIKIAAFVFNRKNIYIYTDLKQLESE